MALKKRESIFQTWGAGEEVSASKIDDILAGVTGDKAPAGKSLENSKELFEAYTADVKKFVPDKEYELVYMKTINGFGVSYFADSRSDQSLRTMDFYDKYLEKEKLPSVIACDYIYNFCKVNCEALEKESKNYGSLKTRFTHDEIYVENLKSYINDVILFSGALREISKIVSSSSIDGMGVGYYLNSYKMVLDWSENVNKMLGRKTTGTHEFTISNITNAASCFMLLSMLKASCEAFSELSKKIEVIRTKFNKIFNKARDLQKKFDDSHVSKKLGVAEAMDTEADYLPKDSKTVKIGKPFRKKAAVLSSVSSSQYTGSLDPEHNIKHKCFEICKATVAVLKDDDYKLLTEAGADKLREAVPACFDNLIKAEKDGFCIDYGNVDNYENEKQLSEHKNIFDSLETIIQPFVDSSVAKDEAEDKFTIDNFKCNDLKKFMFAVEQLRKLQYGGKEILVYKYTKTESKNEQDLTIEVILNGKLNEFLTNFEGAVTKVNKLLTTRDEFLSTFSKTWVLDTTIVDNPANVKSGKVKKDNRNLNDLGADDSLTTKAKNAAKTVRNALVRDIQCDDMEKIIKKRGKLPETADRRVFPSLDTYEFVAVNNGGAEIQAATHNNTAGSTISEKTGIKDAKAIAEDIFHLAVMSRAYGYWVIASAANWTKYEGDMKNRYVDFKDPFRA